MGRTDQRLPEQTAGMKVDTWCAQNGITKANYYYRLRRVREAYLSAAESNGTSFVEMPVPVKIQNRSVRLLSDRFHRRIQLLSCIAQMAFP
jgi:hypothetical protein